MESPHYQISHEYHRKHLKKLGPISWCIYTTLISFCGNKDTCFPSHKTISEVTGVSIRAVINHLRKLEEMGYIKTEGRTNSNGSSISNLYCVIYLSQLTPISTEELGVNDIQTGLHGQNNRGERDTDLGLYPMQEGGAPDTDKEETRNKKQGRRNTVKNVAGKPGDNPARKKPSKSITGKPQGFFSGDSEIPQKTHGRVSAELLYNRLQAKRKIFRPADMKKWSAEIDSFLQSSGLSVSEFDYVLQWYCDNIGGQYVPQAFSAKAFCDKFARIQTQAEFSSGENNSGDYEKDEQVQRIMKRLEAEEKAMA